jgi:glycosyltransferase involved in cell wall biosynthesis
MNVLMISMDTALLTQQIGNSRARHQAYADEVGRVSIVVCNRRKPALSSYSSSNLTVQPTNSATYLNYLFDGYRAALGLATEYKVDLITTQDPFLTALIGIALRRKLKVPLLIQDHSSFLGSQYFARERFRNRLLRRLALMTLPHADAVRVVNSQERDGCIKRGISPDRVCVIPLVPDIARFRTNDLAPDIARWRKRLNLTAENPVVLWVGRPVPVKNLPMLLRAFGTVSSQLSSARLVIAGDTSGTDIPGQIDQLGLTSSVRLPGAIAHTDLPALYQAASVYAMSSNYEGLPVTLLEASAAAIPMVSTANNGAHDLILDGESGVIVPINDDAAMAHALLDLLCNPDKARQMGQRARQHVGTTFNEQMLMDRWMEMWRSVAAGESPCAS